MMLKRNEIMHYANASFASARLTPSELATLIANEMANQPLSREAAIRVHAWENLLRAPSNPAPEEK